MALRGLRWAFPVLAVLAAMLLATVVACAGEPPRGSKAPQNRVAGGALMKG